ncbi:MAG: hypothetical protein AAGF99_19065 [Bacteroidota bacterium]
MGQQQLLLLVLSIVIVGLAVATGIASFGENQRKARQDQMMAKVVDLAVQAQAWKMKHMALGGGANGDSDDYSALTLDALGIADAVVQNGREVVRLDEYTCIKVLGYDSRLDLNVLNADCDNGSWWLNLRISGTSYDDIAFNFNQANAATSGY